MILLRHLPAPLGRSPGRRSVRSLLVLSLLGCHVGGLTTTPSLTPERLMATGIVAQVGPYFQYVYLPVTVQGQTLTVVADLGTGQEAGIFNLLIAHTSVELGIPAADIVFGPKGVPQSVDSLAIGTTVLYHIPANAGWLGIATADSMPEEVGVLGTPVLSHFDWVFDGPTHRVQVYAPPAIPAGRSGRPVAWLPPGVTAADCTPMPLVGDSADHFVGLPVQANGHRLSGLFDSGSGPSYLNLAAAQVLGFTSASPRLRRLPVDSAPQFSMYAGQKVWEVTGVTIQIGRTRLTPGPLLVYEHNPLSDEPMFALGTYGFRDRRFVVSYSTNQVCLSRAA